MNHDLILSFKSWGVHYPITEYIPLAKRCLRPGGLIITNCDDPAGLSTFKDAGFSLRTTIGKRMLVLVKDI